MAQAVFRSLTQISVGQAETHELLKTILSVLQPDDAGENQIALVIQELVETITQQTAAVQAQTVELRGLKDTVERIAAGGASAP
ncbi:hypothetical protein K2X14_14415 [Acetobacter sp. TBRC 12305]|uniref:Uncharacterized protein n=1 Tax=Acetobacter garciniae TaxID=2817435 RepID=A0A939HKS7_9PROT|nr:hypothetical protein [Acetobacter garciniae]MBO1326233.1 hypothetical protein [Acetobacter garciniae]MBX0346029.1 hypothetical protein [Acetobacter garciniae]